MATSRTTHEPAGAVPTLAWSRTLPQRALLTAGVASSLLYAATDVAGGLRYPGYDFTSQAVSELMARGAPSEALVDPLFLLYDLLVVAFGLGLLREAARRGRALRVTGSALVVYASLGTTGPTLFEMNPRGTGGPAGDLPHIVVTVLMVLLVLIAIGSGAFALGRRFRAWSFATLAIVIGFGAWAATFAGRIAAGEPTPGFGIIERVNIYAALLWLAVLGVALLRRPPAALHGTIS
jgi:hypothetical membrane protein